MENAFLIGERIYLRGLTHNDLNGNYISWLNDFQVCKYNSHHRFPYSYSKAESYIQRVSNSYSDLILAMVLKHDNVHIGNISLQNINYVSRNAEFAILLGEKEYWGKGYSKEASLLLFKHGFTQLNLHRIYCGTSEYNIAMQKLAFYLGMKEEGRRKEALYKSGSFCDIMEYGILQKDFFKKNNIDV